MTSVISSNITSGSSSGYFASQAYFECSTASYTKNKKVTFPAESSLQFTDNSLLLGLTIHVKFTYSNSADEPTLQVGSSTAIPIVTCVHSTDSSSNPVYFSPVWRPDSVVTFTLIQDANSNYAWKLNDYHTGDFNPYQITVSHTSITSGTLGTFNTIEFNLIVPYYMLPESQITRFTFSNSRTGALAKHYFFSVVGLPAEPVANNTFPFVLSGYSGAYPHLNAYGYYVAKIENTNSPATIKITICQINTASDPDDDIDPNQDSAIILYTT